MSIAPITPSFGFGVTPGFGVNPAYGVSATPPRTAIGVESGTPGVSTFGQMLAERVAAFGPAAAAVPAVSTTGSSFGVPGVNSAVNATMNTAGTTAGLTASAFGVPATSSTTAVGQVGNGAAATAAGAPGATPGSDMGGFVTQKLGELSGLHARSDKLAVAAATGELKDIHEYTIASSEAGIATQLAVSVRDKALQAFNDIIRMQL